MCDLLRVTLNRGAAFLLSVTALALLGGCYHKGPPRYQKQTLGAPLLAYVTTLDNNTDIYLTWPDNETPVPAANTHLYENYPVWSPDGKWIAYTAYAYDGYAARDIYTVRADLSETHNVSRSRAGEDRPAWSPDGQWIAFVSDRDGNPEIYIARPDGSDLRNLTQHPYTDDIPAWSPDRQWIAFVSDRENPGSYDSHRIFLMRPDGTDVHRLTGGSTAEHTPTWSPNGQWIAFEAQNAAHQWDVFVIRPDGTECQNLSNSQALSSRPVWSPDNQWIAHFEQADATGRNRTYLVNRDGSGWRPALDLTPYYAVVPTWSPDGQWIALEGGAEWDGDILLTSPQGGPVRNLTGTAVPHAREPRWSADGQWLAFMVCDDLDIDHDPRYGRKVWCRSHMEIYAVRPDGSGLVNLSHNSTGMSEGHTWSPLASSE